jgi:hypothetical protein
LFLLSIDHLDSNRNTTSNAIVAGNSTNAAPVSGKHLPIKALHNAAQPNWYKDRKRKMQLRSDIGPKVKVRKLPPLKRHPDGRIVKKRSIHRKAPQLSKLT